ncbi:hypothetical protein D5L96_00255 [Listeria monocytogenes]|uniref:DUF1642 domain-containing protein n=1 Tax=Listeria monocytogenes TaxID=1639 RepID=A0AAV6ECC6_LISMN|nr:hypothetical protein [Listeria monocytogenes]EAC4638165.1 hypothetical protein [Listeria monocytogenes]EAC5934163.1 hypothetical protein [Listeria monocytogenes]EAC9089480.1 hypothetical protein [Listeria monocytogenes]EAD0743716.1 hypothetical protein [Listeria monocytogenes]EAD2878101.1 hypothetical protein [Listeria monocytogenes]
MKKFELGERVQFIRSSELKVGAIKRIYEESNEYQVIVDDSNLVLMIHKVHLAKLDQPEQQSEKVKKINEIMLELIHRKDMDILSDADITKMLIEALDIVNTLDEPKPVVVEEQKKWVVSVEDPDGYYNALYFDYFIERTAKEDFPYLISVTKEDSYKFTEKEKADAVAVLIDGTVEEVEAE